MARYTKCIQRLQDAAGRELTDKEVSAVFEKIHKAAVDIKAGRADVQDVTIRKGKSGNLKGIPASEENNVLIQRAADLAAAELKAEADRIEYHAHLQVVKLGARIGDMERVWNDMQARPKKNENKLNSIEYMLMRDYSGRINIESMEQLYTGYKAEFGRKLDATWAALGDDFLGFFQDRQKVLDLVRELRNEESGNPMAKEGARRFHQVAEEMRQVWNENGGMIGKLDDWGKPQHHSQEKVAAAAGRFDGTPEAIEANRKAWVDEILPMLDRDRYIDDITGERWSDADMVEFLGHAWDTISTNGLANVKPGEPAGFGKRANRHAEHRQIHFKDADAEILYWERFGDRTLFEILQSHIDTMAKDIAMVEYLGPNPNLTFQTLRDTAVREAAMANPVRTESIQGQARGLDNTYDYISGRTKPTYRQWLKATSDGLNHLNTAGKLGGAALASFFGDKPMMEAVAHMNDLPMLNRWRDEIKLLNPANAADRKLLQSQGLMLESIRSGMQRFYEGLGHSSATGKLANATMRITGMQAINDIRKGAFSLSLMSRIGDEIQAGRSFADLHESDVRALRNYGITDADWQTWKLARLDKMAGADHVLTPESITRISDDDLRAANIIGQTDGPQVADKARRLAIVKLLGAINSESEFAIVTPGWKERSEFYGGEQRGTFKGEISRAVLQFKAFPWAMFKRGMDAVANMDGPASKAVMSAYLIGSTTLAGAMLMEVRAMLNGQDPQSMRDENWYKFWAQAFVYGGALGIYGDFLYSGTSTRYGSGPLEALSGPTLGSLLEMTIVHPLQAGAGLIEGKDTHFAAKELRNLKGFVPFGNVWYAKPAMDHLIWQRSMEALSPGYLSTMRQKAMKERNQDFWWAPGEMAPERAPDLRKALEK